MGDFAQSVKENQKFLVDLEPVGRRVEIKPGEDLLSAAQQAGVDLAAVCGGAGICGLCKVRLVEGELTPPTQSEQKSLNPAELEAGYRLACQTKPLGNVRIDIPPESLPSAQKLQVSGQEGAYELAPSIRVVDISLQPPALDDLDSDLSRVKSWLKEKGLPFEVQASLEMLAALSGFLRKNNWQARLVFDLNAVAPRLLSVLPAGSPLYGLAVDMGSTKLAAYLVDLQSGATLGQQGEMNPQIAYGEDVVSRIAFCNRQEENRTLLQTRLVETLNKMLLDLCRENGVEREQVVDAVLVGNTAMFHFFAGLPVEQLGAAPYIPVVSDALNVGASQVGLKLAREALFYLPPNIAGYVGADHTSAMLASLPAEDDIPLVLVDIGTNTEISLVTDKRILACSTASGPAFEGAHIRDGMRAAPGAIEDLQIYADGVQVSTIASAPAVGICGTGILKAVSEMQRNGLVNAQGSFNQSDPRIRMNGRRAEMVLVPAEQSGSGREIIVTRKDVNEIQLAKGAIRAGIEVLLDEAGLQAGQVRRWVIAGAFGTYLELESAVRIGMLPDVPLERYAQVGNAAGMGAKQMLLSRKKREEAVQLAARVEYVELTTYKRFTEIFVEKMHFQAG